MSAPSQKVVIGLHAVIIAVMDELPHVLVVRRPAAESGDAGDAIAGLPFGPFDPALHRTLEIGLRNWVEDQTSLRLGYVEQLYTFGDKDRFEGAKAETERAVSVGYLALTRTEDIPASTDNLWQDWYQYFPWEDRRAGEPALVSEVITPQLESWISQSASPGQKAIRRDRARTCFGWDDLAWDEEKVLERYELLYEAGLVEEADRDARLQATATGTDTPPSLSTAVAGRLGEAMQYDHRRILATALGRLRGKLKYRPVVFELMPPAFTLLELQKAVQAISGVNLHKQNFRRLVESGGLVERTGSLSTKTGGRPAELFEFRRDVLNERPAPGIGMRGRG